MHLAHFSHYQEKSCMLYVQVLPSATKALYKVQRLKLKCAILKAKIREQGDICYLV